MRADINIIMSDPSLAAFVKQRVGWLSKLRKSDLADFLEEAWVNDKHMLVADCLKELFPDYQFSIEQCLSEIELQEA